MTFKQPLHPFIPPLPIPYLQIVDQMQLLHTSSHVGLPRLQKVQRRPAELVPGIYVRASDVEQRLRHARVVGKYCDVQRGAIFAIAPVRDLLRDIMLEEKCDVVCRRRVCFQKGCQGSTISS